MRDEAALIACLTRVIPSRIGVRPAAGIPLGIGDDAAVVRPSAGREWILSTDSFVEGVHFLASLHPADAVGYKALARAVSDLAAMGAVPRYFLLALALSAGRAGPWLDAFARGMADAARRFGMHLIGGDLARHSRVVAALTVVGEVRRGRALGRGGARAGDALYVSGRLGAAQAGLEVLRSGAPRARARGLGASSLERHLYPEPRLALGNWLAAHRLASAAIDISDGLSTDLARLCAASRVGAVVNEAALPLSGDERAGPGQADSAGERVSRLKRALHGGEDYELLFTVARRNLSRIPSQLHGVPLTRIGEITSRQTVLLGTGGRTHALRPGGWDHFSRP